MSNPRSARVDVRRFLNLPGHHWGAYVLAYVEDTSARDVSKPRRSERGENRWVNYPPRIVLEISDCSQRINLHFEVDSDACLANSLHKVDVLAAALAEFRAGLVEEAELYSLREAKLEALREKHPPDSGEPATHRSWRRWPLSPEP
jgi:hypothetical protein